MATTLGQLVLQLRADTSAFGAPRCPAVRTRRGGCCLASAPLNSTFGVARFMEQAQETKPDGACPGCYKLPAYLFPSAFVVVRTMTAIVRTFTPEGFVLAADGRKRGTEDDCVLSDCVQKLFPIGSPVGAFAYSICGVVEIPTADHQAVAFSFDEQLRLSAESLRQRKCKNLAGYAMRLSRPIRKELDNVLREGLVSSLPTDRNAIGERGDTICRIGLDGYEGDYPNAVTVRFFHEHGRLCEPEIRQETLYPGFHRIFGPSDIVGRLLFNHEFQDDPRLSRYRGPFKYADEITVQAAIERSQSYILGCSDPEGVAIDEYCRAVGGHIHIATITPSEGFRWVIGPKET